MGKTWKEKQNEDSKKTGENLTKSYVPLVQIVVVALAASVPTMLTTTL